MLVLAIVGVELVLGDLTLVISHQVHRLGLVWETRNSVAAVLGIGILLHVLAQQLEVVGCWHPLLGTLPSVQPVFLGRMARVHVLRLTGFLLRLSKLIFKLYIA